MLKRLAQFVATVLVVSTLASCSGESLATFGVKTAAKAIAGDDSISAESQLGRTNTKQIVGKQTTSGRDTNTTTNKVASDAVGSVTINETPFWLILVALLGWLAPSPREIARWARSLLARK